MTRRNEGTADHDPSGVNAELLRLHRRHKTLTTRIVIEEARNTPGSVLHGELFGVDDATLAERHREKMAGQLIARFTVTLVVDGRTATAGFWVPVMTGDGRRRYEPCPPTEQIAGSDWLTAVSEEIMLDLERVQRKMKGITKFKSVAVAIAKVLKSA